METSQLICSENQLTGFYMMETLVVKGLKSSTRSCDLYMIFLTFEWIRWLLKGLPDPLSSGTQRILNFRYNKSTTFAPFSSSYLNPRTLIFLQQTQ